YKDNCPFCVGNEHLATKDIIKIEDESGWKVRIIPNKFPALQPEGTRERKSDGLQHTISGIGVHDVVIESPKHDAVLAFMPEEDIANVIRAYKMRYKEIRQDRRMEAIVIFKNYGESAGSSLEHTHSQIAATPVVPPQFRDRVEETIRYFDDHGDCIFCRTIIDEIAIASRVISENGSFVAFIPFAALTPFHIWVFPRVHKSSFEDISEEEIIDLASILKVLLLKVFHGLGDPDYNYTIRSSPTADRETRYFHWYLSIIPKMNKQAGFEMGTGMYINSSIPEESAEYLRGVEIPEDK
ncbi:MAG: DUF4931 domain-containing protein, partial [Leptospiraceae bacterium]|nr:DUF4931 domain-containing protein [Leptospiraceae bacterium]